MKKIITNKYFPWVIIFILLASLGFAYQRSQNLKRKLVIADQNQYALNDTIRTITKQNGDLQSSIGGFISKEKDLKKLNKDLYNEVQSEKGKIVTLNKVIIKLKQDSAILNNHLNELETKVGEIEKINDSTYSAPWTLAFDYDSLNYDRFSGKTMIGLYAGIPKHLNTTLLSREIQIKLTWGQKIEDDKLRVFVNSSYPGFITSDLQGVLIDPNTNPYIKKLIKKKRWFTGFSIGIGTTVGYNLFTGGPAFVVGPSFQWTIYNW